jgi:hypothetical protein
MLSVYEKFQYYDATWMTLIIFWVFMNASGSYMCAPWSKTTDPGALLGYSDLQFYSFYNPRINWSCAMCSQPFHCATRYVLHFWTVSLPVFDAKILYYCLKAAISFVKCWNMYYEYILNVRSSVITFKLILIFNTPVSYGGAVVSTPLHAIVYASYTMCWMY